MMAQTDLKDHEELELRRKAARRTAWKLAFLAALIFSIFLLTGVTGRS